MNHNLKLELKKGSRLYQKQFFMDVQMIIKC